jgi:hypothetical protein
MNALEKYQTLAATDPSDGREILAAWDVVERMRERGYRFALTELRNGDWVAEFEHRERADGGGYRLSGVHTESTPADAILGAATAAMESEGR